MSDFKPERRIVNLDALRRARLRWDACAACGGDPGSVHHVLPRGEQGDDVEGNLMVLCGNGTLGCHGALHGNPYTLTRGHEGIRRTERGSELWADYKTERIDAAWVKERIGMTIARSRPDVVAYFVNKLGATAGLDYLARVYNVRPVV